VTLIIIKRYLQLLLSFTANYEHKYDNYHVTQRRNKIKIGCHYHNQSYELSKIMAVLYFLLTQTNVKYFFLALLFGLFSCCLMDESNRFYASTLFVDVLRVYVSCQHS
jgi:hypothetical protein